MLVDCVQSGEYSMLIRDPGEAGYGKGVSVMGVRHAREYKEILGELTEAVGGIADSYKFFEMEASEWDALGEAERREVLEALADDVFYGLGEQPSIAVGEGTVVYHPKHHVIEVSVDGKESRIVRLV